MASFVREALCGHLLYKFPTLRGLERTYTNFRPCSDESHQRYTMHDCSVLYSLSLSLCSFYTARMTSQASRVGIRTNVHEHPLRATCTSFGRFRCGTVYTALRTGVLHGGHRRAATAVGCRSSCQRGENKPRVSVHCARGFCLVRGGRGSLIVPRCGPLPSLHGRLCRVGERCIGR